MPMGARPRGGVCLSQSAERGSDRAVYKHRSCPRRRLAESHAHCGLGWAA